MSGYRWLYSTFLTVYCNFRFGLNFGGAIISIFTIFFSICVKTFECTLSGVTLFTSLIFYFEFITNIQNHIGLIKMHFILMTDAPDYINNLISLESQSSQTSLL